MFDSVNNAFNWMVSFTNLEKKPDLTKRGYRLDKMIKLLDLFNNPQNSYKIIHVAGSKGKGSTCGFLGSILTEAGYKTGVYSSPHLLDYRERITNNHKFFSNKTYLDAISEIKDSSEKGLFNNLPGGQPTTFELMTLSALLIFKKENCNWVVLETGIGGRLDSTNVVTPECSIITPIELEHKDLLGDTIEAISREKAGIIKPKKPVFTSNTNEKILNVLKNVANINNSELITIKEPQATVSEKGTILKGEENYTLGLQGMVQASNALLAIKCIEKLFPNIDSNIISQGLRKTIIPGRFQKKMRDFPVIIDGAHTKNSVAGSVETFKKIYGDGIVIFGAVAGKDIASMAKIISKNFKTIIISTTGNFKKCDISAIRSTFNIIGVQIIEKIIPEEALLYAETFKKPILVTGSFYMAGEIAKLF